MLRTLVFLLPIFVTNLVNATTFVGTVVGVQDGDTIEVLDSSKHPHRIRLAGIDAPEKAQPFGQRSKQNLSGLVFGKRVEVDGEKTDKYGRTVGKVLMNGIDANLAQVGGGFAWHYTQYASEQTASDHALYAAAEDVARGAHLGLWRDPKPMAPWDWRHGGKDEPTATSLFSGCPCSAAALCTGPKGGHYCVAPNGSKRYH
jgi:endonuclease YncB( thermonuclease family)